MNEPQANLLLNRVPHPLKLVIANAKIAPVVEIDAAKINPAQGHPDTHVEHSPVTPEATEREIVFYKQNGGFTVLLGRAKVDAALAAGQKVLKGRLLSTPALKKCRLGASELVEPEPIQTRPAWEDRPRPAYQDRGYQGNRMNLSEAVRAPRRPIEQPRFGGATEDYQMVRR